MGQLAETKSPIKICENFWNFQEFNPKIDDTVTKIYLY